MDQVDPLRRESFSKRAPQRTWQIASITLTVVSAVLFVAVLISNLQSPKVSVTLLVALTAAFCIFSLLLAKVLLQLRRDQQNATNVLQTAEREFQQMAGNIQEIFWMIDADSKRALYVNQAYENITGRSCHSLMENPSSFEDIIHPDDRAQVLAKLEEAAQNGLFNERFRIVRPGGEVRWVWARGLRHRLRSHSRPIDGKHSRARVAGTRNRDERCFDLVRWPG
jgi:PAS domain S-box-containing protein